jgi:simple sugar transport system permease protein
MKKFFLSHEIILMITILLYAVTVGIFNSRFFSVVTLSDTLRTMMVLLILALAEMLAIVSNGIDVSIPSVCVFSSYVATDIIISARIDSVLLAFIISAAFGIILGFLNGFLIGGLNIPPLIATLGMSSVIYGGMTAFIGAIEIVNLPSSMINLSKVFIFSHKFEEGTASLTILIIIPAVLLAAIWFLLNKTMIGRGIYAIGGDKEAASRAGFSVTKITYIVYSLIGFLSGIAGMLYTVLLREAHPVAMMGSEIMVIAAVVMGGVRITGGKGTVLGVFLGVLLINLTQNTLIIIGIPAYFQTFVVGMLIAVGAGITAARSNLHDNAMGGKKII